MRRNNSLFRFQRGDHACVFYSDTNSLMDVLTPYVAEGLRNGERCFLAQKPDTLRALTNDLRFLGVDIEHEVKRGALELHTTSEVYFNNKQFDPEGLMGLLERSVEESVRQGFSAFRTAGELSWAVEGRNDCDQLMGYEEMVQASYPGKPAVGICQYSIRSFPPDVLDRVVERHGKVLDFDGAGATHASLRIRRGLCEAEICTNKKADAPAYQYVIHRQDGEILHWGKEPDFDGALRSVENLIAAGA
jgi:hypothetical protein